MSTPSGIIRTIRTTCPYCGVGCGVQAEVDLSHSEAVINLCGDLAHPANQGRLCSKGSALDETIGGRDAPTQRLTSPRVNGKAVEWSEALDEIAENFKSTIDEFGADSVAFYVSGQLLTEDYYVVNKFVKGYLGTANIDTNSRLCMASSVAGHKRAFGSDTVPNTYRDLELADLVVLAGSNLAWCHPVLFQRILAERDKRPGMKLVVIDPRRTMTAEQADVHLAIKPGADQILFQGLLQYLSEQQLCDFRYIQDHTLGFHHALASAGDCNMARVSSETGLSREQLHSFYNLFGATERAVTAYSQGINQSEQGSDTVNSILNVHLATGRIGKPGCGPFSITGQPNAMGGREVGGLANMLAAHMDIENPSHRETVQNFWSSPAMASAQGPKALDLFQQVASGKIRALWIMATNPVDSMPLANHIAQALRNIPLLIVSDVTANTDTVRYADVLLPAQAWGEKDGTVTNSERCISRQRRLLKPTGQAMPDWWAICQVAKRLGFASAFDFDSTASIFREHAALSGFRNNGSRDFDIGPCAALTDTEYDELSPFQWPLSTHSSVVECTESQKRFFSNGGYYYSDNKARFISAAQPATRPIARPGAESAPPIPQSGLSTQREAYPFRLNTGRARDQWHTMTRTGYIARLSAHLCEPFVEVHPDDAEACGLEDARIAVVFSTHGEIHVRTLITDRQQPGNVFVPMHWSDQFSSRARVDTLIADVRDPVSGQPASKSQSVALERWHAESYAFGVFRQRPDFEMLDTGLEVYWAAVPVAGGWRAEFASLESPEKFSTELKRWLLEQRLESLINVNDDAFATRNRQKAGVQIELSACNDSFPEHDLSLVEYHDDMEDSYRIAAFREEKMEWALFASSEPVAVARSHLANQLTESFGSSQTRFQVLASCAPAGIIDRGAIICSCQSVGIQQIKTAMLNGCNSVEGLGAKLGAGVTCGSCRGELKVLLRGQSDGEGQSSDEEIVENEAMC